jgi:MYXO-CTERM domain-containing protein
LRVNANMWRMYNDFWDTWAALGDPANTQGAFGLALAWSTTATGAVGHWPDADMLPLGHLGPRCPVAGANRNTRFTQNEQVAMLTLWALLPSPLMLGANLTQTNDPFFTALLTNEGVIAVGQDELGAKARRLSAAGTTEIWTKDLSGGRKAVGLFNRGATDATVAVTWTALGLSGPQTVRNLWTRTDLGTMATGASLTVPFHAGALLLVAPPAAAMPDGGGVGVDAASGTGGAGAGTGGAGAAGASGAGTGGSGSGSVGTGGATGATGTGGAASGGVGGSTGAAGAAGGTGKGGGCGCALGETPESSLGWLAAGLVILGAATRRRRAPASPHHRSP